MRRALAVLLPILLVAPGIASRASAWPAETITALSRDARKLLPRSLNRLLGERESQVLDEEKRLPPDISRAVTAAAGSWLAVWREAHGDTTHTPRAKELRPNPEAP